MGDAKWVLKKYMAHLRGNVHQKKHLQFTGAAPRIALPSIYILGDPKGKSECYVGAHGGGYSADYVFDNLTFRVPAGVTVCFTQPAGYSMAMPMASLRLQAPIVNGSYGDVVYNAGDECPNYMLTKWHGRHTGLANYAAAEEDYAGWESIVNDTGMLFVFPRNRWFHAGVTLKQVIKDVQSQSTCRGVTTFWCLFCRVDDSTAGGKDNFTWDAEQGQWWDYTAKAYF